MNNKGFTLVELLATMIILALVVGIAIGFSKDAFSSAKDKTEGVFIDTIDDAMDMYLATDAKKLSFSDINNDMGQVCTIKKRNGYDAYNELQYKNVKIYKATVSMQQVIDSSYHPLSEKDLVNPANKDVRVANPSDIEINIYKDDDYVYYYSIDKNEFNSSDDEAFFLDTSDLFIDNLPIDRIPGDCEWK